MQHLGMPLLSRVVSAGVRGSTCGGFPNVVGDHVSAVGMYIIFRIHSLDILSCRKPPGQAAKMSKALATVMILCHILALLIRGLLLLKRRTPGKA
jgi:hypothetical protein